MAFTQRYFLAVCALLAVGVIRLVIVLVRRARNPLSIIPGPWHTRWTSAVPDYQGLIGKRAVYVERLHKKYGQVVRVTPTEVDFSSISAAKIIHSFNRPFLKSEMYHAFKSGNGVENLFNTRDLDYHARHRRLLSAPLSESSLKNVEHVIMARADLAVQRIGEEMKTRGCADILKWWIFFSTDVIGELTFGDSFRMLEQGKKNQYVHDLQKVAFLGGLRVGFPKLTKFASYFPLPFFHEVIAGSQRMASYAEESIRRYEKIVAVDPINPKPTLFTKMFQAGEKGMSRQEIVADAQSYIVAGSDTTAHSLTYLVWSVCQDDRIKQRLVEEASTLSEGFTSDHLKALPYLNQVIEETLRVYAAAPAALPREVPLGGSNIDGYWVPSKTTVCTQAYSMHRDAALFPDPERFDPSRWESPSKEMKDAWMPFGGGARVCLGLHLAHLELRHATARFFRSFPNAKVSTLEDFSDDDMDPMIYFLMAPKKKRCLIQEF